jgi:hypothetical protein
MKASRYAKQHGGKGCKVKLVKVRKKPARSSKTGKFLKSRKKK